MLKKASSFKEIVEGSGLKEVEVMRALQWLSNKGIVELKYRQEDHVEAGPNLVKAVRNGFPEENAVLILKTGPKTISELAKSIGISTGEMGGVLGVLKSLHIIGIIISKK